MLITKAAAWVLIATTINLPITAQDKHYRESKAILPKMTTVSSKNMLAESEKPIIDVTQDDNDEPPSIFIGSIAKKSTFTTPIPGISKKDIQKAKEQAELDKKSAQEEAERIKHTAALKKLQISQSEQKQKEYVHIIGKSSEECVIYVRRITKNQKVRGYAGDLQPEGQKPKIGSVALERKYGHVSIVVRIEGDYLILHDANYIKGAITERRVPKSDERGYIY